MRGISAAIGHGGTVSQAGWHVRGENWPERMVFKEESVVTLSYRGIGTVPYQVTTSGT